VDGEDGALGGADYAFGDRAEEEVLKAGAAVGSHDDEIHAFAVGGGDDDIAGKTFEGEGLNGEVGFG